MEEPHLSLAEAAQRLGISERSAYRWIKAGKLRAYKPGRDYWIPESAITEVIQQSEVRPKAPRRSSLERTFNDVLAEERRTPDYLREQLRERGVEVNNSEAVVLSQYLEAHENPPTGPWATAYVKREDEPVDEERVKTLLAYVLATGMLSPDETEAAREMLHSELVGSTG